MKQLLTDIFPIDLIYLDRSKNSNQVTTDRELEEQLDDARNLEFIGGNWVANEHNSDLYIYIGNEKVHTRADGNYHLYEKLLEDKSKKLLNQEEDGTTPTKSSITVIEATGVALSYTAQILRVISSLFGLYQQHSFHYKLLCDAKTNINQFRLLVKLLNGNILALCLQNKIDIRSISPHRTLSNFRLLANKIITSGCGQDPILPDHELLVSIEKALGFNEISENDIFDDDSTEELLSDWETVNKPIQTTQPIQPSLTTSHGFFEQPATLVSTAFSYAKSWWSNDTS